MLTHYYAPYFCISLQTQHTLRFSGAQNHHYLLDFLQSVAECYHQDGRGGDLVVDLLKLKVPKLFAVKGGKEEDEAVGRTFSLFLRDYIRKYALKHTFLEKMGVILVSKQNSLVHIYANS